MDTVMTTAENILGKCRSAGLRKTRALRLIADYFADKGGPVAIRELIEWEPLKGHCDPATVYRLLSRLEANGIVRRIGLHERAAHYILTDSPGEHHDYLVCVECGAVSPIDMKCPVHALEDEVREKSGYTNLYHELQFYGTCPECAR